MSRLAEWSFRIVFFELLVVVAVLYVLTKSGVILLYGGVVVVTFLTVWLILYKMTSELFTLAGVVLMIYCMMSEAWAYVMLTFVFCILMLSYLIHKLLHSE